MMSQRKHAPLLMIEGNIGSGKSTLLKILEKQLNIEALFEPTNKWQHDEEEQNLLHLFYKDTPRWAYTFQSYAFISRTQVIVNAMAANTSNKVSVLERSVYCDRYCFAKNCFESGLMTQLEWQIYKEWFSWLAEKYTPQPDAFVYLQTEPQTCYDRINKRNRKEESTLPLSYLVQLHKRHEEWLIQKKEVTPHLATTPVLVLDCNEEFENNLVNQRRIVAQVNELITTKILSFSQVPTQQSEQALL